MTFNAGIEAAAKVAWLQAAQGATPEQIASAIRTLTRPSSSAPVEQREAVALDIADEFILICEAAARQAKRTGNTFVIDRQRAANLIQAKLARYALPGSSRDEALEQIVAVCDDNAADNCGHQLALRFVRNVASRALKSGGAKP